MSGKRRPACGVTVMCYGCYAIVFSSTLTLSTFVLFFFFAFFRLRLGVTFRG